MYTSAYNKVNSKESEFKDCINYILNTGELMPINSDVPMDDTDSYPNNIHPSDHLPVECIFIN